MLRILFDLPRDPIPTSLFSFEDGSFGDTPFTQAISYCLCNCPGVAYSDDAYSHIQNELIPRLAAALCEGTSDSGRGTPTIEELIESLDYLLRNGLPLSPGRPDPVLLEFLPAAKWAGSEIARLAQMDCFLREQLDEFELDEYAQAARILFAHTPGTKGTNLKVRQQRAAVVLDRSSEHVRTEIRPKIVAAFAWQLYRLKLTEDVSLIAGKYDYPGH